MIILQIIFADECTEAEDRCWHMQHFACFECDQQLGGQRYVMKEDKPYCCLCFERCFSEFCDTCFKQIGVDQGQMTHGGQHWHANEQCFKCYACCKPLLGSAFLPKNGVTYCSIDCSRGISGNRNSVDSANDSITSNNSKEDIKVWVQMDSYQTEGSHKPSNTVCVRESPLPLNTTDTYKSNTDNSEGYGSLQTQQDFSVRNSLQKMVERQNSIGDSDTNREELCTSLTASSLQRAPLPMHKSVTFSQLTEVDKANQQLQVKDSKMNPIIRKPLVTRRASLPSNLASMTLLEKSPSGRKHLSKRLSRAQKAERAERLGIQRSTLAECLPEEACSSCCSSSDDSDGDDAYDAEVIRSKGLRVGQIGRGASPLTTYPFQPIGRRNSSTKSLPLLTRQNSFGLSGHQISRQNSKSKSKNGNCAVQ